MSKKQNDSADNEMFAFPEKWAKVIKDIPEFKDSADAASPESLKKIIVTCEGNIYTIEKEKEGDIKLNAAKEIKKELEAPYRDAAKVQMAKIKYALFLLEGKGVDISDK
jgi:hypothetical protein